MKENWWMFTWPVNRFDSEPRRVRSILIQTSLGLRAVIKPIDRPWSIHVAFSSPIWALLFAYGASARSSFSVRFVPRFQQVRRIAVRRSAGDCVTGWRRSATREREKYSNARGEIEKTYCEATNPTLPCASVTFVFSLHRVAAAGIQNT